MSVQLNSPLISVALMTYNQEKYVGEALLSVLNQTYNNLEIIVSDDCSRDGTWDVVVSMIDRYRREGGRHSNIILNRNQANLGVAKHFEVILSKCRGEFVVCQAGDDVSLPERVQSIVDALKDNPRATIILHEAISIDENGHRVDSGVMHTSALMPLGALMAYSCRVYKEFDPISEKGAWEDDVYARRAQMIGDEVIIEKVLLKYRIGCGGISSGRDDIKVRRSRVAMGCLAAARQSRKDLECCKGEIGEERYKRVLKDVDWYEERYVKEYEMYNAPRWNERFQAFRRFNAGLRPLSWGSKFVEIMLPNWLAVIFMPIILTARRVRRICKKWKS